MKSCSRVMRWKYNDVALLCFCIRVVAGVCCLTGLDGLLSFLLSCYSTVLYAMTIGLLRHVGGEQPTRSARKL